MLLFWLLPALCNPPVLAVHTPVMVSLGEYKLWPDNMGQLLYFLLTINNWSPILSEQLCSSSKLAAPVRPFCQWTTSLMSITHKSASLPWCIISSSLFSRTIRRDVKEPLQISGLSFYAPNQAKIAVSKSRSLPSDPMLQRLLFTDLTGKISGHLPTIH